METNRRTNEIVYSIRRLFAEETQNLCTYLDNYATSPRWSWIPIESFEIGISFHPLDDLRARRIDTFSRLFYSSTWNIMSRYGNILNLVGSRYKISPTPGRGEELLRTYLITRRNESKLVIYDFIGGIPNLINRRGPKRRRLASSRSIKYREGSFFCSENPFRPRSLLVSGLNKNN